MGDHSMLATRLIGRIRSVLGAELDEHRREVPGPVHHRHRRGTVGPSLRNSRPKSGARARRPRCGVKGRTWSSREAVLIVGRTLVLTCDHAMAKQSKLSGVSASCHCWRDGA
ncbi:hypothetical protein [Streptomyces noursei]|uniref:hypothetical protein n=1 Tax=Streptomyces noursei TaxID=1971 RepID=UPI003BF57F7D